MAVASPGSSFLIIEELSESTGAQGALDQIFRSGRRIELRGSGLPKQLAGWTGKQRVTTKFYVGNPNATQQVLGPMEMPSEWDGEWHRTMLSRSPCIYIDDSGVPQNVVRPDQLVAAMDELRVRGHRLRVTWNGTLAEDDTQAMRMTREGRISEFATNIIRAEDINWKLTFDWASRGAPAPSVNVRQGADGLLLKMAQVQAAANQAINARGFLTALKNKSPGSANKFTLGQLERLLGAPVQYVQAIGRQIQQVAQRLADVAALGKRTALEPWQVANAVVAIAKNTISITSNSISSLSAIPPEILTLGSRASDVARAARSFNRIINADMSLRQAALELQAQARLAQGPRATRDARGAQVSQPSAGAVPRLHRCRQGQTPQMISTMYYGTPDFAAEILRANRLSWYTVDLTPGQILVIPLDPKSIKLPAI
jgi:hypothetical protein